MPGQDTPNVRAGGTIRPHRAVKPSTTEDNTVLECDASEAAIGVTTGSTLGFDSDNHAVDGDPVHLQPGRVLLIEAAAAITRGATLTTDADGKAETRNATEISIGKALQSAGGAGEIIEFYFNPQMHT